MAHANIAAGMNRAAACFPDSPATVCMGRTCTWREFSQLVEQLCGGLISLGVRPGDRVAIAARNSDVFLHYIYAVAKMGAVLVPLNIRWSRAEHAHALRDSGARVLVVDGAFRSLLFSALPSLSTVGVIITLDIEAGWDAKAPSSLSNSTPEALSPLANSSVQALSLLANSTPRALSSVSSSTPQGEGTGAIPGEELAEGVRVVGHWEVLKGPSGGVEGTHRGDHPACKVAALEKVGAREQVATRAKVATLQDKVATQGEGGEDGVCSVMYTSGSNGAPKATREKVARGEKVARVAGVEQGVGGGGSGSNEHHETGVTLEKVAREESGTRGGGGVCSVMYTSGSNGAPKGVVHLHVSHVIQALAKIAHSVRAWCT
ncbi:hypothetical protein T484DRAFT_1800667 [Baffinella frigidus]|nr:hypothetical protein T484DRAFT_1800667 [Cryptophyta sp. CCMP2293]